MPLVLLALLGCDRTATIADGTYRLVELVTPSGASDLPDAPEALVLDGLSVRLGDRERDAVPWPERDWPEGCPTQLGAARQETWQLSGSLSPIDDVTFAAPVLVADCGWSSGPAWEVLLVDGDPVDLEPCGGHSCARYRQQVE